MADIYERLADIEQRDGDHAEAIELLDKAIGVRLQTQGAMHPAMALTLERMADVEEPVNPSNAADFRGRALAIWERHLGPEHDVTVKAMQRLAQCKLAAEQPADAEALLVRALEIVRRRHGERSPQAAGLMVDCAAAARMQRRSADAKQLLNDALAIYRTADKAPNAAVGVCLHRLGQIALDEKQPATALRLFQQVVAIDESIYGSGHVEVAEDLLGLAAAHAAMGNPDLAEEIRARARAIEERAARNADDAADAAQ
jgi:tetratricopeptide (TPR) repeat protein